MSIKTLAQKYAQIFCEEYPNPIIAERIRTGRVGRVNVVNVECLFGPHQTYPEYKNDLANLVSNHHAHRKFDYETLKKILLLESPKIATREYVSKEEYSRTAEEVFKAGIIGMAIGRLKREYKKGVKEEIDKLTGIKKILGSRKIKRSVATQLQKRSDKLQQSIPNYFYVANFDFMNIPLD
ncbi:hypothetical protein HN832_04485 [archaeon]|jgi:hypothetical protein|nr:hypothetical protein [archaeon]MBT4373350.1 hypothetical protein [archaeon]MBT4531798.1 hypothetical protein [archaeon]MBT7001465.1 hypothetical protein [archaeon]MBT7282643.1 hypothetical protein [archaeon]